MRWPDSDGSFLLTQARVDTLVSDPSDLRSAVPTSCVDATPRSILTPSIAEQTHSAPRARTGTDPTSATSPTPRHGEIAARYAGIIGMSRQIVPIPCRPRTVDSSRGRPEGRGSDKQALLREVRDRQTPSSRARSRMKRGQPLALTSLIHHSSKLTSASAGVPVSVRTVISNEMFPSLPEWMTDAVMPGWSGETTAPR